MQFDIYSKYHLESLLLLSALQYYICDDHDGLCRLDSAAVGVLSDLQPVHEHHLDNHDWKIWKVRGAGCLTFNLVCVLGGGGGGCMWVHVLVCVLGGMMRGWGCRYRCIVYVLGGRGGLCRGGGGVMDFGIGESFSYLFMFFVCIFKTYDMIYNSFY